MNSRKNVIILLIALLIITGAVAIVIGVNSLNMTPEEKYYKEVVNKKIEEDLLAIEVLKLQLDSMNQQDTEIDVQQANEKLDELKVLNETFSKKVNKIKAEGIIMDSHNYLLDYSNNNALLIEKSIMLLTLVQEIEGLSSDTELENAYGKVVAVVNEILEVSEVTDAYKAEWLNRIEELK